MSDRSWDIKYYQTLSGRFPVKEFIDDLGKIPKAKVYYTVELLSEFGIRIGSQFVKKMAGTDLWELRIIGESSIRIFYIADTGRSFVLLHAFVKKSQKTPIKEIKTALKRLRDYTD